MLNFEHSTERPGQFKGTAAIVQKLQSLPFLLVKHLAVTIDCQPTPGGGIMSWCVAIWLWTPSRCRRSSARSSSCCPPHHRDQSELSI